MKEIELTQGQITLVDDDKYDWLMQYKWHASDGKRGTFYAESKINGKKIRLHQLLLPCAYGYEPDHKDGNGLNNQMNNLRKSTHYQNQCNSGIRSNNVSGYKGVYWRKDTKKWKSVINFHYKEINLGYFDNPEEAARAYDKKAKELNGEFAWLNFPDVAQ